EFRHAGDDRIDDGHDGRVPELSGCQETPVIGDADEPGRAVVERREVRQADPDFPAQWIGKHQEQQEQRRHEQHVGRGDLTPSMPPREVGLSANEGGLGGSGTGPPNWGSRRGPPSRGSGTGPPNAGGGGRGGPLRHQMAASLFLSKKCSRSAFMASRIGSWTLTRTVGSTRATIVLAPALTSSRISEPRGSTTST